MSQKFYACVSCLLVSFWWQDLLEVALSLQLIFLAGWRNFVQCSDWVWVWLPHQVWSKSKLVFAHMLLIPFCWAVTEMDRWLLLQLTSSKGSIHCLVILLACILLIFKFCMRCTKQLLAQHSLLLWQGKHIAAHSRSVHMKGADTYHPLKISS